MEQFIKNKDLLDIWKGYNAFHIVKQCEKDSTYKDQFQRLRELLKNDEKSQRALFWISQNYDCHHKNKYDNQNNDNPFYYIQAKVNDLYNKKVTNLLQEKYGNSFKGYQGNDNVIIIGINNNKYTINLDNSINSEEDILKKLEYIIDNSNKD